MKIRRRPPNPSVAVESLRYQIPAEDAAPQHILEEIVWHKEKEVDQFRDKLPLWELQKQMVDAPSTRNFLAALRESARKPALIAEVKKASPSKGIIRADFDPVAIAESYVAGGAACLSVLTDQRFFQGSFDYLTQVRAVVEVPLLCKDFIIYPYQIYKARLAGADAALLIAAILSNKDLQYFLKIIKAIGMTALIEVHTLEELDRVLQLEGVELIGINNRNLEDFSVSLDTTRSLLATRADQIKSRNILVVAESGLHTTQDLAFVHEAGADVVLVGESLVKQPDPKEAIASLYGVA